MVKVGITSRGHKGLERAIDRFEEQMIREVKRVIAETAELIAAQARALAPVAEIAGGNLRQSIEVTYHRGGLSAEIRVGAFYGVYVEYGTGIYAVEGNGRKTPWVYYNAKIGEWVFTRGMKAQAFFHPSVEYGARHFENEMNKLGA